MSPQPSFRSEQTPAATVDSPLAFVSRDSRGFWLPVLLNLMVIWLVNARLAPDINESHYLTKARHFWDSGFAAGDLFLSSGNAHWLFAHVAGWMSSWMPLIAVAWVGRVVSWSLMAVAWHQCARQLRLPAVVSACVLLSWMMATRMGNWAGEWAIGGFEAKSLAYPCVMLAIADCLDSRWPRGWIWIGLAIAFHPLVGGWAGLTLAGAWLWFGRGQSHLRHQWIGALVGLCIALIGIGPALAMIGGPSRSGQIVVAQIHAYLRLAHHQTPHLFAWSQHVSGIITLTLFCIATGMIAWLRKQQSEDRPLEPTWKLLCIAWLAVGVSGCGLLIDVVVVPIRPDIAAGLLRFYWFRWSDIIVPLAWVLSFWVAGLAMSSATMYLPHGLSDRRTTASTMQTAGILWLTLCGLAMIAVVSQRLQTQWESSIAPADERLLMSDSTQLASGPEVVSQWIEMCAWVRENTPRTALFFTPRAQQTFKWYAERAEVVSYKDVPQDSQSLLDWYERINRCAPPRNQANEPLGYTNAQILRLHQRYKFQYIIVDRRIQREAPLLELVYPLPAEGSREVEGTFAIFKLPSP